MKINRSRFEHLINKFPHHKLYPIGKDKYLEIRKPKYIFKSILELLADIILFPIGFIWCLLGSMLEFMSEMPEYLLETFKDLKSCSPITYVKVVDDEIQESIK